MRTLQFLLAGSFAILAAACSGTDEVEEGEAALGSRPATPLDRVTVAFEISWDASAAKVADSINYGPSQKCTVSTGGVIPELYGPETNNERRVFAIENEYKGASTKKVSGTFSVPRYDLKGISGELSFECKKAGAGHHQYTIDMSDATSEVRTQEFTRAVPANYSPSFTSAERMNLFAQVPFKVSYRITVQEAPTNLISNCGEFSNLPSSRVQTSYLRLGTNFGGSGKAKKWSLGLNVDGGELAVAYDAENNQKSVQHVAYCAEKKNAAEAPLLLGMTLAPRGSNEALPVRVEAAFGMSLAEDGVRVPQPSKVNGKIGAFRFRIPNESDIVTEALLLH